MADKKHLTLDHINDFFSLSPQLEPLSLAPSVTGGLGIDNIAEFPPPVPETFKGKKGTSYVADCLKQENQSDEFIFGECSEECTGLDDLEELSTTDGTASTFTSTIREFQPVTHVIENFFPHKHLYNPNLSITEFRDVILHTVNTNQAVIIQGTTGCGKTTQVPQYILDQHVQMGQHCNIVVTQPRKIAAQSIAHRVCYERDWEVGSIVGYQIGMDNKTSEVTRISYVTTGVLLQKLINSRRMTMYTHVIIDEVHERNQDTDFLLLIVKKLLVTNSKMVKVILMSATIEANVMANYFSDGKQNPAPIIDVTGHKLEVAEYYLEDLIGLGFAIPTLDPFAPVIFEELYDIAAKLIRVFDKIEMKEQRTASNKEYALERGAVLVFLPGFEQISKMSNKLLEASNSFKYTIFPLHSSITMEEQSSVFRPPNTGFRKVILSTNIAESSITVADIKYVIDFCLTKNLVCDSATNYVSLQLEYASKSQCTQRKGRAGRVGFGRVYRLVPQEFYNANLLEHGIPEIKRCPLTQTVLYVKKLKCGSPQSLLAYAIDPPDLTDIENAVLVLKEVGALRLSYQNANFPSASDGDLTYAGEVMASLPLDVHISKLILLGHVFDCLEECIVIAASLSLQSFISKPFRDRLNSYKSTLAWARFTFSDCVVSLNAYYAWRTKRNQGDFDRPGAMPEDKWAKNSFLQLKRLREVDRLVTELKSRLVQLNINVNTQRRRDFDIDQTLLLKIVIAGAFYPNYYAQEEIDEAGVLRYVNNANPYTSVAMTGLPPTHGILYFSAIRDFLQPCGSQISVEFEDRKAYIHFNPKPEDNERRKGYPVPSSVFYAVKMRMLRMIPDLFEFSRDDAEKKMTQLKLLHEKKTDSKKQDGIFASKVLGSNVMNVQAMEAKVKTAEMPLMNQMAVDLFISHVVTPGQFWARYSNQKTTWQLEFMETIYVREHLKPLNAEVTPGMLILAPFGDKLHYYRATVEDVTGNEVQVFYIDFGNTKVVKQQDLCAISSDLDSSDLPAVAFECQLSGIKPSAIASPTGNWTPNALSFFQQSVNGKTLTAKVYSVVQHVVRVELLSSHGGMGFSINEELIRRGFAEHAEESFLSEQDHNRRLECAEQCLAVPSDTQSEVMQFTSEDVLKESQGQRTENKIRLHGPVSPLESSYKGLTYSDRLKGINIDRDSVNSVSFNPEPQDKQTQFLVAASVSLNQRGDSVNARNTTLMPKILGLQQVLCMVFAPMVEMRTDRERKEYTGALCGLGYDLNVGGSVYPDHDMEVTFNCNITDSDIFEVNAARMGINLILGGSDIPKAGRDFHRVQNQVIESVIKVVKRKRQPKELIHYHKSYKWKQVPNVHILTPGIKEENLYVQLLPLVEGINLSTAPLLKELILHRNELKNQAGNSLKPQDIKCNFCNIVLRNQREVRFHLQTPQHLKNEEICN